MLESPTSLQEYCLDFICENISAVCETQTDLDTHITKLQFRNDVYLHGTIAERLLHLLGTKGKLDDLTLTLFDASVTNLKYVSIHNASITAKGLCVLRSHKVCELEAIGLSVAINDLIGCLGDWTLANLKKLNVSKSTFVNSAKYCVVVSLSKLHNLQTLNVSQTEFNIHGLEIISEDLPLLENLDISCTKVSDITPLRKCKHRLKSLAMYKLLLVNRDAVSILCELDQLRHLDVSDDVHYSSLPELELQPQKFDIFLLEKHDIWPNLVSLDISGRGNIIEEDLKLFLDQHPQLQFLGLALTHLCGQDRFVNEKHEDFRPALKITGDANKSQIVLSLRLYVHRTIYVQKALHHLFTFTQLTKEPYLEIIKLILPVMRMHSKHLPVQMAATACFYNLTQGEAGLKIHVSLLREIVNSTLDAMENFPKHQQLQKNTLLTLCSDRILQDVVFDKFRCAQLVMDCLCAFDDASMNRMAVAICSILAAKIPTEETSLLGANCKYMNKLLSIVRQKMDLPNMDVTLKFTLSALWNLTDESPNTCKVFLEEGGLDLFMDVLKNFQNDSAVETKVLGLVNNIAEVQCYHSDLMKSGFVSHISNLLHSTHIDVSYFSAGIIAHLANGGNESWIVKEVSRKKILQQLAEAILGWKNPAGEMVAYRSFSPFFPLLEQYHSYEIQLWAVWAIHHVCSKNSKRYCPMLVEELGVDILQSVANNPNTQDEVIKIVHNILELLQVPSH